jgi:addiction module HigA family antidote
LPFLPNPQAVLNVSFECESGETKSNVLRYTLMKSAQPNDPDSFAHPLLKRDVLPGLGLSVTQAAMDLKVRRTLRRILAGTAAITPEMAPHLERLTDIAAMIWFEPQENYDLHRARSSALP